MIMMITARKIFFISLLRSKRIPGACQSVGLASKSLGEYAGIWMRLRIYLAPKRGQVGAWWSVGIASPQSGERFIESAAPFIDAASRNAKCIS
jgi:hypothetical protein